MPLRNRTMTIKTIGSNKRGSTRALSVVLTFAVISALIIAGPALAWQVSLHKFSNQTPVQGEITTAKFNFKLQDETNLGFKSILVSLDGPEDAKCYFDIH